MNFQQFQASKREIPVGDLEMPDHIAEMIEDFDGAEAALVYDAELWIIKQKDGNYWLLLERDEWLTTDLVSVEAELFGWYKSERLG